MEMLSANELLARHCEAAEQLRAEQARQMHGELGALLVAARMALAASGNSLDAATTARLDAQLADAMIVKQRVLDALRPGLLDHFGPGMALADYFETRCRAAGVTLESDVAPPGLPRPVPVAAIILYRVGEAALSNALKDGAHSVSLSVAEAEGWIRLRAVATSDVPPHSETTDLEVLALWAAQRGGHVRREVDGNATRVLAGMPSR